MVAVIAAALVAKATIPATMLILTIAFFGVFRISQIRQELVLISV